MTTMAVGRQARRDHKRAAKRAGLMGAAAATAAAMTVGLAGTPVASALPSGADVTTTGPLLWLAAQLGFDTFEFPNPLGGEDLTVNLNWTNADPVNLYDVINSVPFGLSTAGAFVRPALLTDNNVAPILLSIGTGTTAAINAHNAMLASGAGDTPAGFTPLTPGLTNLTPNVTDLTTILARNPYTPNGGIFARFPNIAGLFGMDGTSPDGAESSSTGIRFRSMVANIALGYDWMSDFPVTANWFSLANSFLAGNLPTYLLGGAELAGATAEDIEDNLIGLLVGQTPSTSWSTLNPTDLPLLEPLRLPARLINLVLEQLNIDFRVPTILADILEPAARILVNIGYTDVVTPSEGGTYNRTFDQSATETPWLSAQPLTFDELLAVPGDVLKALVDGFTAEMQQLFGGATTEEEPAPAAAAVAVDPAPAAVEAAAGATATTASDDAAPAATNSLSGAADDAAASDEVPSSVTTAAGKPDRKSGSSADKSSASASAKDSSGPSRGGVGSSKRARAAASDAA